MEIVSNHDMPKSNGHYSQCIKHNGILYLSGQLPINTEDGKIPERIEEQTDLVLENVEKILISAGSNKNNVIRTRIYIPNVCLLYTSPSPRDA